ncbi:MAG: hypothetical protein CXT68_06255, partial [Methanobacteriota archaeon]
MARGIVAMLLLSTLVQILSQTLIDNPDDINESMEPTEQTQSLYAQSYDVNNYSAGGYHMLSDQVWWEPPLPFSVSANDQDGDGTEDANDSHPLNPAIPIAIEQSSISCGISELPCARQFTGVSFNIDADWDPGESEKVSRIAWGDIDLDGDQDLVRVNGLTGHNKKGISLGDVDGDGDLDAVVTEYGGTYLYLNIAGELNSGAEVFLGDEGSFPNSPSSDSGGSRSRFSTSKVYNPRLGDMDGDGDLDLVGTSGSSSGDLLVFKNSGTGFSSTPDQTITGVSHYSVDWGDYDGDGDLDIAAGTNDKTRIYLNSGTSISSSGYWESSATMAGKDVRFADIDGDERLDLIVATYSNNEVFFNSQSGMSTSSGWSSYDSQSSKALSVGDIDNDGDLDLLVGNFEQSDQLFLNIGGSFLRNSSWETNYSVDTLSIEFADVDGDGDLDISSGNIDSLKIHYNRKGNVISQTTEWTSSDELDADSIDFGDINGDGLVDMVTDGDKCEVFYNQITDSGEYGYNTTADWHSSTNCYFVKLGDIDGDGDLDLVSAGSTNYIYENENGLFSNSSKSSFGSSTYTTLALGDVDNDGDLDIAAGVFGSVGQKIFHNNNGAFNSSSDWSSGVLKTADVKFADMDGDGWQDLVIVDYFSSKVRIYENQNGAFSTSSIKDLTISSPRSLDITDFDSDGDMDILAGGWSSSSKTKVFENSNYVFITHASFPAQGKTTESIWADVDGDGDMDVVEGFGGGKAFFYLNHDGKISETAQWQSTDTSEKIALAVADINNDGSIDLAIVNENEKISIYFGATDADKDGTIDSSDIFEFDPTQAIDSDSDGHGDHFGGRIYDSCTGYWGDSWRDRWGCPDEDSDGQSNLNDDFWRKDTQWVDTDGDGRGDNWGNSSWDAGRSGAWPGQYIANAYLQDPYP